MWTRWLFETKLKKIKRTILAERMGVVDEVEQKLMERQLQIDSNMGKNFNIIEELANAKLEAEVNLKNVTELEYINFALKKDITF
jgi:hypothetical protein